MNPHQLRHLVELVATGQMDPEIAYERLSAGPFHESVLPNAHLDHHRALRQGLAETVYGEGKTIEELVAICDRLAAGGDPVLVTRLDEARAASLVAVHPTARRNAPARTVLLNPPAEPGGETPDYVAIVAAGTSDLPVAEEAAETCGAMGVAVRRRYDIGVAGLHRVAQAIPFLRDARAIIVVAGMEGALPSVIGGLVACPVFAVPTSVGYGASFGGVAALLGMLNSCAPGIAVFNIDNGFSAGVAASRVVRAAASRPRSEPLP